MSPSGRVTERACACHILSRPARLHACLSLGSSSWDDTYVVLLRRTSRCPSALLLSSSSSSSPGPVSHSVSVRTGEREREREHGRGGHPVGPDGTGRDTGGSSVVVVVEVSSSGTSGATTSERHTHTLLLLLLPYYSPTTDAALPAPVQSVETSLLLFLLFLNTKKNTMIYPSGNDTHSRGQRDGRRSASITQALAVAAPLRYHARPVSPFSSPPSPPPPPPREEGGGGREGGRGNRRGAGGPRRSRALLGSGSRRQVRSCSQAQRVPLAIDTHPTPFTDKCKWGGAGGGAWRRERERTSELAS